MTVTRLGFSLCDSNSFHSDSWFKVSSLCSPGWSETSFYGFPLILYQLLSEPFFSPRVFLWRVVLSSKQIEHFPVLRLTSCVVDHKDFSLLKMYFRTLVVNHIFRCRTFSGYVRIYWTGREGRTTRNFDRPRRRRGPRVRVSREEWTRFKV